MSSPYDVHVWKIRKYESKRKTTYTVRWAVAREEFQQTFETFKLAESFRAKLLTAAREGVPFDEQAGLLSQWCGSRTAVAGTTTHARSST